MPHFVIWKKNAFGTLEQNFQEEIISWKGNKGKEVSRETDNALEVNKLKEREKKKSGENRKLKIIRIACIGHDLSVISSPNKRDSSSRYDHSITQIVSRGIFSKVPRGTKTSGETSRKRRKGRRKKEERTYANWQLEIATERNWNRLRGKLLKLHLTGNISQRNAWILLLISSCFKNWPQGATNFQEARVSRVPRVSGCVLLRLSSVFV